MEQHLLFFMIVAMSCVATLELLAIVCSLRMQAMQEIEKLFPIPAEVGMAEYILFLHLQWLLKVLEGEKKHELRTYPPPSLGWYLLCQTGSQGLCHGAMEVLGEGDIYRSIFQFDKDADKHCVQEPVKNIANEIALSLSLSFARCPALSHVLSCQC